MLNILILDFKACICSSNYEKGKAVARAKDLLDICRICARNVSPQTIDIPGQVLQVDAMMKCKVRFSKLG